MRRNRLTAGRRGGALGLLSLLLLASPALGAAESSSPASRESVELLAREMAGIRGSIDRIALLLEGLLAGQETDLILRRIELKERRLDPLLAELMRLRSDLDDATAEKGQLAGYLESLSDEVTRGQLSGEDVEAIQSEREQIETMVEAHEETIVSLESRIRGLEDEVADGREEIEILEEILDERLDRR